MFDILKQSVAPITRVTLSQLLRISESRNAMESAQFLYQELPRRLARRVTTMNQLPFIVGVNPWIRGVHDLYASSFQTLASLPDPSDSVSLNIFNSTLKDLVSSHSNVIPDLAKGFIECGRYMSRVEKATFLDGMIHARIAIRVLAEHHLSIIDPDSNNSHTGLINVFDPYQTFQNVFNQVEEICEVNYGTSPQVKFIGDLETKIFYVSNHVEYIAMELLKNACRATVEHGWKMSRVEQPEIEITIAKGPNDVIIRIRDQGGGISSMEMKKVFEYSYTTVPKSEIETDNVNLFSSQSQMAMLNSITGPIAGLGFGLPMSNIYAQYFGGSLQLQSVSGHGLDVFLRLPSISHNDAHVI